MNQVKIYKEGYMKGYADAMNWKVQNYVEHWPAAQPNVDADDTSPERVVETDKNVHEIIELAKTAGIVDWTEDGDWACVTCELFRFAKLVAAKEREACAKVCDAEAIFAGTDGRKDASASNCAYAIRARGEA